MQILKKWNTLRNQILFVFLFVMIIVLLIVGAMTFNRVSMLLESNAKEQLQQVAIETNGRMDTLYDKLNMNTKQVVTDDEVQRVLSNNLGGHPPTFMQRQMLMQIANKYQVTVDGINSSELYTKGYQRIYPLDGEVLSNRVDEQWIEAADQAKGGLVWIGQDPEDRNLFLAIRQVSIMDRAFTGGGYLVVRVNKNYFRLKQHEQNDALHEYTILVDQNSELIATNFDGELEHIVKNKQQTIDLNNHKYMFTKQTSDMTGWTVIILTPVDALTEGISVLRTGIVISGLVGFVIFFVCSFFLSTIITRPISKLTETMRQAGSGTLHMNPEVSSTNEINELNQTYNLLVKETNHLIQMVYEKELIRSKTELKALQAQINPHFLFNTLDALYWSLEESDEEELADLVLAMSDLFRYTITKNNQAEWVTIKQEMEHIERYVQIMKFRFGERLKWNANVPSAFDYVKIPKLLIQPLVENAILHGAENKVGNTEIMVSVEQIEKQNRLLIKVADDGPGIAQETIENIYQSIKLSDVPSRKGNGIALSNVQKRLDLYYRNDRLSGLKIESTEGKGTSVFFEIPLNGGENNA
ncbi:sensor histidine kinase [Aquibacillus albus]|nr:sensor histidine kinase [Aquibacillus albus]